MSYAALRRTDGRDVYVNCDKVLAVWSEGDHCRSWAFGQGHVDLRGSAHANADELDLDIVSAEAPE